VILIIMTAAAIAGYLIGRWHGVIHERDLLRQLADEQSGSAMSFEGSKICRNCGRRIWIVWNRCPHCHELAGRHKPSDVT
jgi:hypothetical protein